MNLPRFRRLAAALVYCALPLSAAAQGAFLPGSLDFLFTDTSLWSTPPAELPEKLKSSGYTPDPLSIATATLGDPQEMLRRKAHVFFEDVPVWKATLSLGTSLRSITLDLMPPPRVAKTLDRAAFRAISRKVEEGLTSLIKSPGVAHPIDYVPGAPYRTTCQRWLGKGVQVVFTTSAADSRTIFTPQRLELRILRAVPPGKPALTKAPAVKADRTTGLLVLEGLPPQLEWDGSSAQWLVLEQALHTIGKETDRNTILDCALIAPSYPFPFSGGIRRIAVASGAKVNELSPFTHVTAEMSRIAKACDAAANRLGKHSPEAPIHLVDFDPEVLRAARCSARVVSQFANGLKTALTAGRPVLWYGWRDIYPEEPAEAGAKPSVTLRLIIGFASKENEVIFAGSDGQPGPRMKLADALAAALYTVDLGGK